MGVEVLEVRAGHVLPGLAQDGPVRDLQMECEMTNCLTNILSDQISNSLLNVLGCLLQWSSVQLCPRDFTAGLRQQNLQTLHHGLGHGGPHVSALQCQDDLPFSELEQRGRHGGKAGGRDIVATNSWRMSLSCVEPRGYEDDAGVEVPDDGTDDRPHGCQVLGVREREVGAGPGDVDIPSLGRTEPWTRTV